LLWDRHSLVKESISRSITDINLNEVEKQSNSVIESLK